MIEKRTSHYKTLQQAIGLVIGLEFIWIFATPNRIFGKSVLSMILKLNSEDLIHLFFTLLFNASLNLVTFLALILPFFFFQSHQKSKIFLEITGAYLAWILIGVSKNPTLYSESILAHFSPITFFGFFAIESILLWFCLSRRLLLTLSLMVALVYLPLPNTQLTLPKGSLLVFVSDSISDRMVTQETMPRLTDLHQKGSVDRHQFIIPSAGHTNVSMSSFLTGTYPKTHGVQHMFSRPKDLQENLSLVNEFNRRGYCSVAVSEYPGDFLSRHNFSFSFSNSPNETWKDKLRSLTIQKNPFLLSSLISNSIGELLPKSLKASFLNLMIYSDPTQTISTLASEIQRNCGNKKVFAFVMVGTTHMPYIQSLSSMWFALWKNPLKRMSYYSIEEYNDQDNVNEVYAESLKIVDKSISAVFLSLKDSEVTVLFTSDHGEILSENSKESGHGKKIPELRDLAVPIFILNAKSNPLDISPYKLLSNSSILPLFLNLPNPIREFQYTETGIWLSANDFPEKSITYPVDTNLFTISSDGFLIVKAEFEEIMNLAKHKAWISEDERWDFMPNREEAIILRNQIKSKPEDAPLEFKEEIESIVRKLKNRGVQ